MSFSDRLLTHLGFSAESQNANGRAPFELIGSDRRNRGMFEWTEVGDGSGLEGEFAAGALHAELSARTFDDSAAVEVSGAIRNDGSKPITGVRGCAAIRLFLALDSDEWGDPVLRSWRGVRLFPNFPGFFPPDDFGSENRQLVSQPFRISPLAVHSGADGYSASEDLPFAILAGKRRGLALGVEWSGTWYVTVDEDLAENGGPADKRGRFAASVQAGLWNIDLDLRPGESLPLPTVLLVPYDGDIVNGRNKLRRHIRDHVTPRLGGEEARPVTAFNHFYTFENDFSDAQLRPAVDACAAAGLEYFCVDAGWYVGGFRDGIGNWDRPDPAKFPQGIEAFTSYVRENGMRYGTHFEAEYAHVKSSLYQAHPDWFFPAPGFDVHHTGSPDSFSRWFIETWRHADMFSSEFRLLNFGLPAVQEYWVDLITRIYHEWGVRWLRWDPNQGPLPFWAAADEPGWAQIHHVRGLYNVWDHLLDALPDLLIDQCAAGGNRMDLGTARRGHSYWINDQTHHTDLVRRMQTRVNQVLPGNYPSSVLFQPGHAFSDYDYLSHGCGGFGYSGRLWEAPPGDARRYAAAIQRFKDYRHLLLGDYSFELADPENRYGAETHRWLDADGGELVIEFNGKAGPRTAAVFTNGSLGS